MIKQLANLGRHGASRNVLTLSDLAREEAEGLVELAIELKLQRAAGKRWSPLKGRTLALIFDKSSTRTRVSFEAAMAGLGGSSIFLSPADSQLGRGESVADTSRVVSRMVDAVAIRTFEHADVEEFAEYSEVPVINALTDVYHPMQLLADVMTYVEERGSIQGKRVTFVGDGASNVCHSFVRAAELFDFELRIAAPKEHEPAIDFDERRVVVSDRVEQLIDGADLVVTDVWASMGQEKEAEQRLAALRPYQVSPALMNRAADDALFMHCLPAHRGEEISRDMLDDRRSVVWQEAENRFHTAKAVLVWLIPALEPDAIP
jgi:ornithine carbamoyltransferase